MGCASSAHSAQVVDIVSVNASDFETRYDIKHVLGEGSFAKVHACVSKETRATSAVKILRPLVDKDQKKAKRELDVWQTLGHHKHIVSLLDSYQELSYYFVMPQCKCSLQEMLKGKSDSICDADVFDAFHQVFSGLQHIHSLNVVHRDMKAANVLVDFEQNVKIADFGLSMHMPALGCTGLAGSVPYMSPEMVSNRPYGFETDIWSCGVMMYVLVCGSYPYEATKPFKNTSERKEQIIEAITTNEPAPDYKVNDNKARATPNMQRLIQQLLERKRQKRPDASSCAELCLGVEKMDRLAADDSISTCCSLHVPKGDAGNEESSLCPTESTAIESVFNMSDSSLSTRSLR